MQSKPTSDAAILDTWREQGADRLDPLAFHYLVALQRRMADHDGDTRQALEKNLSTQINAYANDLQRNPPTIAEARHAASTTALGELTEELGRRASARNTRSVAIASAPATDTVSRPTLPEMGVLDDFRKLWSSIHTSSQVRRSLQSSPENAGPLNSSSLVHRSLTLMREVSPGYLQQFMSYVDALSWLEQLNDHGVLAAKGAMPAVSGKLRAPRKPRKRREPVQAK